MSRKDYILIAEAFAASYADASPEQSDGIDIAVANLADTLAATNPAFNRDRFIAACRRTLT